jgi:hypothetical protein
VRSSTVAAALLSLVSFCAGTLLIILPWSSFWDNNHFFQLWPPLETLLLSTLVRVAVTGLGLMDFVVGIAEMQSLTGTPEA